MSGLGINLDRFQRLDFFLNFVVNRQSSGSPCDLPYTYIMMLCYDSTLPLSFPSPPLAILPVSILPTRSLLGFPVPHIPLLSYSPLLHLSDVQLSATKQGRFLTQGTGGQTHPMAAQLPSLLLQGDYNGSLSLLMPVSHRFLEPLCSFPRVTTMNCHEPWVRCDLGTGLKTTFYSLTVVWVLNLTSSYSRPSLFCKFREESPLLCLLGAHWFPMFLDL